MNTLSQLTPSSELPAQRRGLTILHRTALVALAGAILVAGSPLLAGPLYSTSFNGAVNSQPADWVILAGPEGNPGWRIDPDGEYRFDVPSVNALSHYTGQFTNGQAGDSFTDGTVTAAFRKSGSFVGLAARVQDASKFYHARLHNNNLEIYRFGGSGGTDLLASTSAADYASTESWTISMTLLGTTINASLYDQNGDFVATASATDANFSSGTVGVRGNDAAVWEDYLVTAPANLNVDIGLSVTGNQVQTDFQSFAGVNDSGSNSTSPKSVSFTSDLGNANRVRVEVAAPQSGHLIGFRDRADVTHELGDLAEDFVYNVDGSRLNLTLGSLLPGYYEMTTYHHDTMGDINGRLDLSVSDARGSGRVEAQGVAITGGGAPTTIGGAKVSFHSDGVNPVVLHVDWDTANLALLNGFQLTPAAESLRVDFGATGQDVQNGFMAFTQNTSKTYASSLGASGSVTVGLAGAGNSLTWRNRVASTAPELPDVAEDFVFNTDYLELTLTGLATDPYFMTTYHHDLTHVQSDLEITVWDAAGEGRVVEPKLRQTVSTSNDPALTSFAIYADEDPVTIRFTNLGRGIVTDSIVRLNGFSITLVPEPGTALLACMGLLGLLLVARRRR